MIPVSRPIFLIGDVHHHSLIVTEPAGNCGFSFVYVPACTGAAVYSHKKWGHIQGQVPPLKKRDAPKCL